VLKIAAMFSRLRKKKDATAVAAISGMVLKNPCDSGYPVH